MDETVTLDALTQFLYHEMTAEDAYLTSQVLGSNAELRATYTDMLAAKAQLPKVLFSPSNDVLSRILQHSAQSNLECV